MTYEHLRATYNNKKVFLTGHTGFKGSWLLQTLHELGAIVRGYALEPENDHDLYHLISGDELCDSEIGDIRQAEKLKTSILNFQPDFIFHLAAQPLVRLSYELPIATFEVNAIGTANVLESVRHLEKGCKIICITTDKVYRNLELDKPFAEDDPYGGYDPYSASKACSEIIIDSYRNSFFALSKYATHKKSIASARAGNVIGGGDWAKDRLVPDIARALRDKKTINIRSPHSVRPWQHVIEPIVGYLQLGHEMAAKPTEYSEGWNIGPYPEDAVTVEQLVQEAIKAWGTGNYEVLASDSQPHEAKLLRLDITKLLARVAWKPKYNSATAIAMTTEWYKAVNEGADARELTLKQIHDYLY